MEKAKPKSKSKAKAIPSISQSTSSTSGIVSIDFEIRGKVQGVHFRKYTQAKAKTFGLKGWVQNTDYGSVIGCLEGQRLKIDMMKDWLRRVGSPKSQIALAEFKNLKVLSQHTFQDFLIVK